MLRAGVLAPYPQLELLPTSRPPRCFLIETGVPGMEHWTQTFAKASQPCVHTAEPPRKQDQVHGLYVGMTSGSIAGHPLRIAPMGDVHGCSAQAGPTSIGPRPRPAIGRQRAHHTRQLPVACAAKAAANAALPAGAAANTCTGDGGKPSAC